MSGKKDATEEATPKKRKDARRDGNVARTPDLSAWAAVLAASFLLPGLLRTLHDDSIVTLRRAADFMDEPDPAVAVDLLRDAMLGGAMALVPLLGGVVLAILAGAAVQGGLRPAPKLLVPKFNRLNPAQGLKRLAGPRSWWEGAKTLIKTVVLGAILYSVVRDLVPTVMASGAQPLGSLVALVGEKGLLLLRTAAVAGLAMAVVDYLVARRRVAKDLRMTLQEVRDEHRNSEGDPQLRGAIRSRQIAMSRNRMMAEVATADVVLTNPTHVAVALRYDPAKGAPRVVAKGAGVVAARIREAATRHRVPIVQDVPLARALHGSCELGQEIPADLFGPVARVLAFLHRLRRRGSVAGTHRVPA
jgi:flagellar biosynthesis protein FlhB